MTGKNIPLPSEFVRRIKDQIADSDAFVDVMQSASPISVRFNPNKKGLATAVPFDDRQVPWCKEGIYLGNKPTFGHDPNYHAGLYYPMEASSMFLEFVLKFVNLPDNAVILDLCAAPGGKTLILKDHFPDHLLVSNEIVRDRAFIVNENAMRWGTTNHFIGNWTPEQLLERGEKFDLILVDAPCSGEGLFRKDHASREEWTPERSEGCAVRQSGILKTAVEMLKPGGWLIYSTCTFNPAENINQINQIIRDEKLHCVKLDVPGEWNIEEIVDGASRGYQLWPHRLAGEGLFISLLKNSEISETEEPNQTERKKFTSANNSSIPETFRSTKLISMNDSVISISEREELHHAYSAGAIRMGTNIGKIQRDIYTPHHAISMIPLYWNIWPKFALNRDEAISFLQGNSINSKSDYKGPILLTHNGLALGFGKSNSLRINNLLPKWLRMRSKIL